MSEADPIRSLWANQAACGFTLSPEELHRHADRFRKSVRRRNMVKYAAAGLVVGIFGLMGLLIPEPAIRAGCVMIAGGALYVCWKLHTLARASSAAQLDAALNLTEFHKNELLRQRDALDTVWRWYLAPFVPGLLVFLAAVSFAPASPAPIAAKLVVFLIGAGLTALIFGAVWWLNVQAVRALDQELAGLGREEA